MDKLSLEDNTLYEVLITTTNSDGNYHTKVFGVRIIDDALILNLYPNKTLQNLKNNNNFLVQVTDNPLLFTKAVLGKLTNNDYTTKGYLNDASLVISATIYTIETEQINDQYGSTPSFKIKADINSYETIKSNPPIISRATYKLIELLVDYTRLKFFDNNRLGRFYQDIDSASKFISKNGNILHKKSLELLKKEVNDGG